MVERLQVTEAAAQTGNGEYLRVQRFVVPEFGEVKADGAWNGPAVVLDF